MKRLRSAVTQHRMMYPSSIKLSISEGLSSWGRMASATLVLLWMFSSPSSSRALLPHQVHALDFPELAHAEAMNFQ